MIERTAVYIHVVALLAYIDALLAAQQVISTVGTAAFGVALVVQVGVPHVVPQFVVLSVRGVVGVSDTGITVVCPAETWEGEGAIEARISAHKRIVGIVCHRRSFQLGVGTGTCGNLSVCHGEQVHQHGACTLAATTSVGGTYSALPVIVLLIVQTITSDVVVQCYKHSFGVLAAGQELSCKVRTIHIG